MPIVVPAGGRSPGCAKRGSGCPPCACMRSSIVESLSSKEAVAGASPVACSISVVRSCRMTLIHVSSSSRTTS